MVDSLPSIFSLPHEEIQRRRARRLVITQQISSLEKEMADIDRWMAALSVIFPWAFSDEDAGDAPPNQGTSEEADEGNSFWRQTVLAEMCRASSGMTPRDIAQAISNGSDEDAKQRLRDNPNGHYNAINRLLSKKVIVKHNSKYYTKELFSSLSDEDLNKDNQQVDHEGMPGFILRSLSDHKQLKPDDFHRIAREDPVYSIALAKTPGIVYSALSRMVKRNQLVRVGAYYALPTPTDPSDIDASDGTETGL